jgi:DNA invertase Pin-like site-specific DNA recombinase
MTQTDFIWDVTAGRHGGNKQSRAANLRINQFKETNRERIRSQIAAAGFAGLTINELKIYDDNKQRFKPANELSPRLTELVALGLIYPSGRQRESCSVYVARKEWSNG